MSLIISLAQKTKNNLHYHKYLDQTFLYLNKILMSAGLPIYQYAPKMLSQETVLPWMKCWPSDLDYLKFIAAQLKENPNWNPDKNFVGQRISVDLKRKFIAENKSHLICHENYTGFYIPVDFKDKCLPDMFLRSLGSSISLRDELAWLACKLKLNVKKYNPDFEILYKEREYELKDDPLGFEKMLLLYLYNLSLASVTHNLIIEFS
jgi:hypothetical protein